VYFFSFTTVYSCSIVFCSITRFNFNTTVAILITHEVLETLEPEGTRTGGGLKMNLDEVGIKANTDFFGPFSLLSCLISTFYLYPFRSMLTILT